MKEGMIMIAEIDKEKTGERIGMLMDMRGLSVKEVCRILSLGCVQSVYKWLDGTNLPSLDNVYCLSRLLQVPMEALICGKEISEKTEYVNICVKRVCRYYKKIQDRAVA